MRGLAVLIGFAVLPSDASAAEDWHLADWSARAVVQISEPVPATDTAAVKVLCQGRAKPDGSDYRVIDSAGQPVPFQIMFHDVSRYSVLAFRAPPQAGARFFVYFGNADAERSIEQVSSNIEHGSGPPEGDWTPRAGLVFSTMLRPEGENPETVDDLEKLIANSTQYYGARYQQRVSDGHNPFGPSDYYISVYRGWIRIPSDGEYKFCTASNEASFSFLDDSIPFHSIPFHSIPFHSIPFHSIPFGKKLVHWPGRHTSERGMRGEQNETVTLTTGLHYLEYYHEEVTLKQVAFLGWSPPGTPAGHFGPIPESVYTAPHATEVKSCESTNDSQASFEPDILDSIWPSDRHTGQYTRVAFRAAHAQSFPDGTKFRWEFGDGHSADGTEVEHVFLRLGRFATTLTADGPQGQTRVAWPLEIYEIQHVTDDIRQGRPPDYAKIAASYDLTKLDALSLKELMHLFGESDQPQEAVRAGQAFIQRFAETEPKLLPLVHRQLALNALQTGEQGIDEAIKNFQASITDETPPVEKIDSIAQLILLLGIERKDPGRVPELLSIVAETAKQSDANEDVKAAYRRAINAAGDVSIWHGNRAEAREYYRRVEALSGRFIPPQVRDARVGAYPRAIREYISMGNFGAALNVVDEWEDKFATEKIKGHTFFWRGTILSHRGQHRPAARYLARAIGLATGAQFETEARWRLARALEELGRLDEAKSEYAKLIATGINDEFTQRGRETLRRFAN